MISLALAALAFTLIHLGISGTTLRDRLVAGIGLRGYMVLFSVLSVGAISWLSIAYQKAPYDPTWGQLEWWKPVIILSMLPAFVLVVAGLLTPNPTSVAGEALAAQPPRGIVAITRHPFLIGVALWSAVHLVGNGDWASLFLFGALFVVAAAGTVSIDAKRRRAMGPAWDSFARQTSIVPFAAIAAGRARFVPTGFGWRAAVGVLAFALMLGGHAHLVGISPWPNW